VEKSNKQDVKLKALNSYKTLGAALEWVNSSKESDVTGNQRLIKNLRTGVYQVRRLANAAEAKMCIGVYGPSQSGKSYLVSALARKNTQRLTAIIGNSEVDFIEKINPEGGKESTGLVTRFTLNRDALNNDYPIQLKLLSELDLIKVFINSYVNDISQDEDDELERHQEQVEQVLKEIESMPRGVSPLTVEDVYDLEDYCNERYASINFRIQSLKKIDFWSRAAQLLPTLGNLGRLRLVQVLWEELPSYTSMYSSLATELERLNHAPKIFSSAEALFDTSEHNWARAHSSIINVSSLEKFGAPDAIQVNVYIPGGTIQKIALPSLCALTSELVIPMRDKPHEMFERADLLDFPGARSRKAHPKKTKLLSQPEVQIENFLRGKVSYLFDKYSADLELTSMVLCIGPSNQEVVGLDAMIEDWIIKSHGEKPESREKLKTSLFFVLSKFDQEFLEGAGKTLDGSRWSTRLQASLINSFGSRAHKTNWVKRWTTTSPFNNIYWLRNPNADQSGLIEYEGAPGSSSEIGFASKKTALISNLKSTFLTNPLVQQHFMEPLTAWNSGMELNDGGASYLMNQLNITCTDDLKLRQIDERLNRVLSAREVDLKKYYKNSDIEILNIEKLTFAKEITEIFAKQFTKQRLGELIRTLLASDIDTVDTFKKTLLDFERDKHAKHSLSETGTQNSISIDPRVAEELGLELQTLSSKDDNASVTTQWSFPEIFVQRFIDEWIDRCFSRFSSVNLSEYVIVERELILGLLNELETAARRDGLITQLIKTVSQENQYLSDDRRSWIWRQTAAVTGKFNEFISRGGIFSEVEGPISIKTLNGIEKNLFEKPKEISDEVTLSENQTDFSERYLMDWIQAMQHSVRLNAAFQAGIKSDLESNKKLGELLKDISSLLNSESIAYAP